MSIKVIKNYENFPGIIKFRRQPIYFDNRGYFRELWNEEIVKELPEDFKVVQENLSMSNKGIARGLHFQSGDTKQAKFIQVLEGLVLDFWYRLDYKNQNDHKDGILYQFGCTWLIRGDSLYLPNNYAHGFVSCNDNTLFLYKVDNPYSSINSKTINFKNMIEEYINDSNKLFEGNLNPEHLFFKDDEDKMRYYDTDKLEVSNTYDDHSCSIGRINELLNKVPMTEWKMSIQDENAPIRVPISYNDYRK